MFSSIVEFFSYILKLIKATSQEEEENEKGDDIPEDASPKGNLLEQEISYQRH